MAGPGVIIVGAGPAGTRAAGILAQAGLRPTVIDEGAQAGGQIYRRQPQNFSRPPEQLYGAEAAKARALHGAFDAVKDRIDYRPDTLAWNLDGGLLHVVKGGVTDALPFAHLVIAAGATDRLMPVPGWTLPGVYSLGGAQIALKAQACSIGAKVAFLGTGPLLYLVAAQYVQAGATVAAVLDTSVGSARLAALPELAARPMQIVRGLAYLHSLRDKRIPVLTGVVPMAIAGSESRGVASISVRRPDGRKLEVECDAVGLGYHLRPETQLADLAQCDFAFDHLTRQWLPVVDEDGRTSTKGIYLAGDGARLAGADGAEIQGQLAAYAVLRDLGYAVADDKVTRLRRSLRRMERFRRGLARAFEWPWQLAADLPDSTLICRCEAIDARAIRLAVRDKGAAEINRVKAFCRVGMGRCQGRYCGHAAAELVAAASGVPIETVGRLRSQAPIKPLSIATDPRSSP